MWAARQRALHDPPPPYMHACGQGRRCGAHSSPALPCQQLLVGGGQPRLLHATSCFLRALPLAPPLTLPHANPSVFAPLQGTGKLDKIELADWNKNTINSWRHSIWVGVFDPWFVVFKGPRIWYKTLREIVTLERMHQVRQAASACMAKCMHWQGGKVCSFYHEAWSQARPRT